jgi:hypothetical protein
VFAVLASLSCGLSLLGFRIRNVEIGGVEAVLASGKV